MAEDKDDIVVTYAPKKICLIPDGVYEAQCIEIKRGEFYGHPKIYLKFKIIQSQHEGVELWMPFNLYKKITRHSKFYEAWVISNKGTKPKANDRMSARLFLNKIFRVQVGKVETDKRQRKLSPDETYSVVREILELCA